MARICPGSCPSLPFCECDDLTVEYAFQVLIVAFVPSLHFGDASRGEGREGVKCNGVVNPDCRVQFQLASVQTRIAWLQDRIACVQEGIASVQIRIAGMQTQIAQVQ